MTKLSELYIRLRFSFPHRSVALNTEEDPESFLDWIHGQILASDESGRHYHLGSVRGVLVELSRGLNCGFDAFDIADADGLVFSHLEELLPRWEDGDGPFEEGSGDILIVDSIVLAPAVRGYGIGPAALVGTMEHFYRYGLATVIQPWPLQFEKTTTTRVGLDRATQVSTTIEPRQEFNGTSLAGLSEDLDASLEKIRSLWRGIGFREVEGGNNVWVFSSHHRHSFDRDAARLQMGQLTVGQLTDLAMEDPEIDE